MIRVKNFGARKNFQAISPTTTSIKTVLASSRHGLRFVRWGRNYLNSVIFLHNKSCLNPYNVRERFFANESVSDNEGTSYKREFITASSSLAVSQLWIILG